MELCSRASVKKLMVEIPCWGVDDRDGWGNGGAAANGDSLKDLDIHASDDLVGRAQSSPMAGVAIGVESAAESSPASDYSPRGRS